MVPPTGLVQDLVEEPAFDVELLFSASDSVEEPPCRFERNDAIVAGGNAVHRRAKGRGACKELFLRLTYGDETSRGHRVEPEWIGVVSRDDRRVVTHVFT